MIKSYRGKLVLLIVMALSLVQLGSSIATLQVTRSLSEDQATQSVKVGAKILQQVLEQKEEQYRSATQVLVSDYGFKSAVATEDTATLATALDNHSRRLNADLVFLLDSSRNNKLSAPVVGSSEMAALLDSTSVKFDKAEVFSRNMVLNQHPYTVVFAPVKAPTIIGWVGMGFLLDEAVAEEIKQITNLDVGFVAVDDELTSYSTIDTPSINDHFTAQSSGTSQGTSRRLAGLSSLENEHLLYVNALSSPLDEAQLYSYLYVSSENWLKRYYELRNNQLLIFLVVLLVAIGIAVWLAKEVSRPVEKLVRFA
ncbi:hypothetical protein DZA50_01650, partial [Kangiella sp. HD9-110m-PIT-SAG07]